MSSLPTPIQKFAANTVGRDIVVGDIHGCFHLLERAMAAVSFNPAKDRLFCCGDLIDRGPLSGDTAHWLNEPWFFSVMGNHEANLALGLMARNRLFTNLLPPQYHDWFLKLPRDSQMPMATALASLPVAIEIETAIGPVGITHAGVSRRYRSWQTFIAALDGPEAVLSAMWSRKSANLALDPSKKPLPDLAGIKHVFHGHTIADDYRPFSSGNRYFIDTGAYFNLEEFGSRPGGFTLCDITRPDEPLTQVDQLINDYA